MAGKNSVAVSGPSPFAYRVFAPLLAARVRTIARELAGGATLTEADMDECGWALRAPEHIGHVPAELCETLDRLAGAEKARLRGWEGREIHDAARAVQTRECRRTPG